MPGCDFAIAKVASPMGFSGKGNQILDPSSAIIYFAFQLAKRLPISYLLRIEAVFTLYGA
jgi:hypothetical protein